MLSFISFYEREVPSMSKALSPKDGKRNTTRSKIIPFAVFFQGNNNDR